MTKKSESEFPKAKSVKKYEKQIFSENFYRQPLFIFYLYRPNSCSEILLSFRADNWERRTPEAAKIDAAKLKEAIGFAIASESKSPRNLELAHYQTFGREPLWRKPSRRSKSAAMRRE
ncbi:MAG: hypothetical protein WKF71_01855 [Pyrinomonadaceae bacterium]